MSSLPQTVCTLPHSRPLSPAPTSPLLRCLALALLVLLGPAVTHGSAVVDLGDITALATSQAESGRLDGTADAVQTYRFTLTATKAVTLGLRVPGADADLYLEAADGTLLHGSEQPGPVAEWIAAVLPAGAYAVQVEAREAGKTPYTFHYEVEEPDAAVEATPRGGRSATEGPRRRWDWGGEVHESEWMLAMRAEAVDLGDITDLATQAWQRGSDRVGDDLANNSYKFTLTAPRDVTLLVTDMAPAGGDVNLFLLDGDLNWLDRSWKSGSADDEITRTLRAGTYYIDIRGFFTPEAWHWELTYALGYSVSAASEELPPIVDDFPRDTSTTGTVPLTDGSGEATGDIESIGDHDWFRVALEPGQTYEINLQGRTTGHGTLKAPVLQLYDADGVVVPWTANAFGGFGTKKRRLGTNARQFFTPPLEPADEEAARTYYISARAYRRSHGQFVYGALGTYTVSVDEYTSPEGDDYPSFVSETPPVLTLGGVFRAEIETISDRDWFAMDLVKGGSYTIRVIDAGSGYGTMNFGWLQGIYDAQGKAVADGVERYSGVTLAFQPSQTGRYYASADADEDGITLGATQEEWDSYHDNLRPFQDRYKWVIGTYAIVLGGRHLDPWEGVFQAAWAVGVGVPVAGELEYGNDHNWYKVVGLEAGKTYQIDLKGASSVPGGTLLDPALRMFQMWRDAEGAITDSERSADDNGGEGWDSRLVVAGEGEYYLLVGASHADDALEDGYRATGTYTVLVTDITPGAEPPDIAPEEETDGAARTVAVGGVTRSTIRTAATCELVEVELEANTPYRIDLAGASTSTEDGALPDPYLGGLYHPAGALIPGTTNDDGGPGRNSQVIFTPTTAGTYSVNACAYGASSGGTYTLSVEEMADDFSADTDTAGTVTVGGAATGEVQAAGDLDWFAVSLEAGTSYVIELEGVLDCEDCTLLEPALHGLYDAGVSSSPARRRPPARPPPVR